MNATAATNAATSAGEARNARDAPAAPRWAVGVLVALLVWVPLPLASNRPLAWAALEVVAMLSAAAVLIWMALGRKPFPAAVRAARWPLVLMAAWLGFLVVQMLPLGHGMIASLNPAADALRAYALPKSPAPVHALSIDPASSLAEFRKALAYVSVFLLVLLVVDSRQRLRMVATAMVGIAALVALYGLAMTLTGIEMIWWSPKTAYRGFVTGTFVNRNHFATFMGLGLALGLGLLLSRYTLRLSGYSLPRAMRAVVDAVFQRDALIVPALLVMLAALVLTASRGGTTAFGLAVLISTVVAALARGWNAREVRLLPLLIVIAVVALAWLGPGQLPERLQDLQSQRVIVWSGTLKMVSHYLYLGAGNGSFEHLFPLYGSSGLYHFYDHAHNDYLEVAAEQGIVGVSLLALVVSSVAIRVVRAVHRRKDPLPRGVAFAALIGMLTMLLHAAIDFPFEIPALATWFFAMMGLGIQAGTLPSAPSRSKHVPGNGGAADGLGTYAEAR